MNGHDPRLDEGRAALIAQLDEARAKVSELGVKLNEANTTIGDYTVREAGWRVAAESFRQQIAQLRAAAKS